MANGKGVARLRRRFCFVLQLSLFHCIIVSADRRWHLQEASSFAVPRGEPGSRGGKEGTVAGKGTGSGNGEETDVITERWGGEGKRSGIHHIIIEAE